MNFLTEHDHSNLPNTINCLRCWQDRCTELGMERDRYRKTLETIASCDTSMGGLCPGIAREALYNK